MPGPVEEGDGPPEPAHGEVVGGLPAVKLLLRRRGVAIVGELGDEVLDAADAGRGCFLDRDVVLHLPGVGVPDESDRHSRRCGRRWVEGA